MYVYLVSHDGAEERRELHVDHLAASFLESELKYAPFAASVYFKVKITLR